MLTDNELQSLRNLGNEAEAAADEIERLRAALQDVHDLAGWHTDDHAVAEDESPDDMVAHVNGLIRSACANAIGPNKEVTG